MTSVYLLLDYARHELILYTSTKGCVDPFIAIYTVGWIIWLYDGKRPLSSWLEVLLFWGMGRN